jgi:phosphoglucosamine mutase
MVSALQVLATVAMKGVTLHELKQGMHKYPQLMINVPLEHRIDVEASQPIQAAVKDAESALNGKGRVLLRPSGTEPLIRVMVEGEDESLVHEQAKRIAAVVEQTVAAQARSA